MRQETKAAIAATNATSRTAAGDQGRMRRPTTSRHCGKKTKAKAGIETLRQETKAASRRCGRRPRPHRGDQCQYRDAAAGERETDSPWQERHHQVGCRRQSRDCRHDRRLPRSSSSNSTAPSMNLARSRVVPARGMGSPDRPCWGVPRIGVPAPELRCGTSERPPRIAEPPMGPDRAFWSVPQRHRKRKHRGDWTREVRTRALEL